MRNYIIQDLYQELSSCTSRKTKGLFGTAGTPADHANHHKELSASGHVAGPSRNGDGSSGHEAGLPGPPGLPEDLRPYLTLPNKKPSTGNLNYEDHIVGFWFNEERQLVGVGLEVGNIIPSNHLPRRYQSSIRSYLECIHEIFFVVYALRDGKIIGIDNMKWNYYKEGRPSVGAAGHMMYYGHAIDYWKDRDGNLLNVRLFPRNIIPDSFERLIYNIKRELINVNGLRFFAYRLRSGYITGVLIAYKVQKSRHQINNRK
ncbi:uncharacterized protein LOC117171151 [Belonocnema kinseyi]|uniref:uncharacterized protein LOC117171151 n=1 Tax=Belonocnema kinseyi TaxID=2817044 RepID=UPI00143CE830|nr:uncharacterized protein LOC117171151 [Belonocnema kinseyi]